MSTLSNHMSQCCDPRLPGILSFSIKEAYRFLDELTKKETLFLQPEMKKTWGYLRNGLVDVALKQILESSNIEYEIADKTTSKYKNGNTYLMIEAKGAIITPAKVSSAKAIPKKAIYRDKGCVLNKNYNLFDDSDDLNYGYDDESVPFLILTYGGANHELKFVSLGLPDTEMGDWVDIIDITNTPVLLSNPKEVISDLQLTFTEKAEEIMRSGENEEASGTIQS